ncbi:MAG: hypothetical protein Q7R70_06215 [Candidatus Diapherotrites archaeon]|nr:hypothetical protein [Candidatus Diapherotrites archaeon]
MRALSDVKRVMIVLITLEFSATLLILLNFISMKTQGLNSFIAIIPPILAAAYFLIQKFMEQQQEKRKQLLGK